MKQPIAALPGAMQAMMGLIESIGKSGLGNEIKLLVDLRASQINGCAFCVDMHAKEMRDAGESDERIFSVAAWRETDWYTDAERVALEMTEVVTRMADTPDPVSDELWTRAEAQFDERQLAGLLVAIATINVWNHVNVPTHQPPGLAH
jgi:AhpD family alkylhydroperoxidase